VLILAHALIAQNRQGEAIVPLEKALRRSSDAEIETLLGAALCGSRRSVAGIEQLRRTAARRPPYLPAFQELAGQLAKTGQLNEAIRIVEDGLALAPESIDLKVDLGRLLLQNNDRAITPQFWRQRLTRLHPKVRCHSHCGHAEQNKREKQSHAAVKRHSLQFSPAECWQDSDLPET